MKATVIHREGHIKRKIDNNRQLHLRATKANKGNRIVRTASITETLHSVYGERIDRSLERQARRLRSR